MFTKARESGQRKVGEPLGSKQNFQNKFPSFSSQSPNENYTREGNQGTDRDRYSDPLLCISFIFHYPQTPLDIYIYFFFKIYLFFIEKVDFYKKEKDLSSAS